MMLKMVKFKITTLLIVTFSAYANTQIENPIPIKRSIYCEGPGFDYAELDVLVKSNRIDIRIDHFFFGLNELLRTHGLIEGSTPGLTVGRIKVKSPKDSCYVDSREGRLIHCNAFSPVSHEHPFGLHLELYNRHNGTRINTTKYVTVSNFHLSTRISRSADILRRGVFADVNLTLAILNEDSSISEIGEVSSTLHLNYEPVMGIRDSGHSPNPIGCDFL